MKLATPTPIDLDFEAVLAACERRGLKYIDRSYWAEGRQHGLVESGWWMEWMVASFDSDNKITIYDKPKTVLELLPLFEKAKGVEYEVRFSDEGARYVH